MMEQVKIFSSAGDDVLLEYDPATANMDEINRAVDELEKQNGGRAFSMSSGEAVERITPETRDVVIVRPLAGG